MTMVFTTDYSSTDRYLQTYFIQKNFIDKNDIKYSKFYKFHKKYIYYFLASNKKTVLLIHTIYVEKENKNNNRIY